MATAGLTRTTSPTALGDAAAVAGRSASRPAQDWPNAGVSRTVVTGATTWHLQRMGTGPVCLLVHGTGASTHTWRDVLPLLARDYDVLAPDLPGHGFSDPIAAPDRPTLPGMAAALSALLKAEHAEPEIVIGHSAGAAILARMALDGRIRPRHLVSLNGAFFPFNDRMNVVFAGIARALSTRPIVSHLFARRARSTGAVERLMRSTGSDLDARGIALYARLLSNPAHVRAVLAMMANWDLSTLAGDMTTLEGQLNLFAGLEDRTVSPGQARRLQGMVPCATVDMLPGLGHLAHEEAPARVVAAIAGRVGVRSS